VAPLPGVPVGIVGCGGGCVGIPESASPECTHHDFSIGGFGCGG
jgi:hypothetical protein